MKVSNKGLKQHGVNDKIIVSFNNKWETDKLHKKIVNVKNS